MAAESLGHEALGCLSSSHQDMELEAVVVVAVTDSDESEEEYRAVKIQGGSTWRETSWLKYGVSAQ